ncbi:MAG: hypothetical protein ACKVXR_01635 [Planctomycetota bacterium]
MRMRPRSLLLTGVMAASGLAVVLTTPQAASAWPGILIEWQNVYPGSSSDDNFLSGGSVTACQVCHVSVSGSEPWNGYGWEIRRLILSGLSTNAAILKAELWDSDDNPSSWANLTEVNGSTQPGWTAGNNNTHYFANGSTTVNHAPPTMVSGTLDPAASPMTPLCDPGVGGVMACPCGNPAEGVNRGCDNSSTTSGAAMTATGNASLAADTLQFKTAGEKPTALSIVAQWNMVNAAGVQFGQGVRCTAGSLKRLFSASAVGGSITAPTGVQPSISAQSAIKGDTILAGQSRWYLVYYRDNTVLGACPPLTNFNATQTGQVVWGL